MYLLDLVMCNVRLMYIGYDDDKNGVSFILQSVYVVQKVKCMTGDIVSK